MMRSALRKHKWKSRKAYLQRVLGEMDSALENCTREANYEVMDAHWQSALGMTRSAL
jgi:hypothetical protein